MNTLRTNFELWTASYWAIPLDRTYMPEYDAYVDETLQGAWSAFKAATLAQQEVIDELQSQITRFEEDCMIRVSKI